MQAQLELAEANLKRADQLVTTKAISSQAADIIRAECGQAQAELKTARAEQQTAKRLSRQPAVRIHQRRKPHGRWRLERLIKMIEPDPDSTAIAELVVAPCDLASALPNGAADAFPSIFATARMVAHMEIASARILQPCLAEN